jgi:hypothetical protein
MKIIRLFIKMPTRIIKYFIRLLKALLKKIIVPFMDFVLKRPSIKHNAKKVLERFPSLKTRLKSLAISSGILKVEGLVLKNTNESNALNAEVSELSPHAKKIYSDLKNAIEERKDKCV